MTEEDDVILPPPEPLPPLPPEIDPENNQSVDNRDEATETNQTKKHRNFVSKYNQDALVNFDNSFSANVSTSNASSSRSNSELSNTVDQELKPCNGLEEAGQIAESMVDSVIYQAISLVSKDPSNEREIEESSVSISDEVFESKDTNMSGQTAEIVHNAGVDRDAEIDVKKDQEAESDDQNSKYELDEGDNSHTCSAETKVEDEEENSEGLLLSGSLTRHEDTFSIDKSHDQTNVSEDLLSDDLVDYTAIEVLPVNDTESIKIDKDENEAFKEPEPPAKVNINILNALYFPTKLVNGYVSISRDYDITSLTLSLICEGNQSITWVNTTSTKNSEEKINQNSEKIIETQSFFTDYVDLIHKESSDHETLKFAFSYQFPPNLPSSFSYVQNDEKDLCAVIEYSFILLDIKENQIIAKKSINMYEAPPYHYLTESKKDSMKIFYLSCINKGTVTLKAELDKGCYFLGDMAQIRCCVENDASEKISEIGVYLCRYLHFKDRKFNQCKVRHVLNRQKFYELEGKWSSKSHGTVLPFEIKEVGTQSVSSSQFINCYFTIRVAIKTKSGYDLFVDLDVVLYNPNQNRNNMRGNGYDLDLKTSPSFGQNSDLNQDSSSSSSSSSSESFNLDNGNEIKTKEVALNKKIVDSDQYHSSRKSSKVSAEYPIEHNTSLLQNEDSDTAKSKDLSNHLMVNQHDAKENFQIKQEENLDVELPRFPEDYLPTSGDESDDLSMQDVIVHL